MFSSLMWFCIYVSIFCALEMAIHLREGRKEKLYEPRMLMGNFLVQNLYVLAPFTVLPSIFFYSWLFRISQPWHLTLPNSPLLKWSLIFLAVDFSIYVAHVLLHYCNILWAAHVVHHQSTSFDLTVAGRNGLIQVFIIGFFVCPLALLGVTLGDVIFANVVCRAYMIWVHTKNIGGLGPIEYVFCTPAQHRVHHYKDLSVLGGKTKNFGALFCIWDRIFGTFSGRITTNEEFGVDHNSPYLDPLKCQTYYYSHLFRQLKGEPAGEKFRILFTSYMPETLPSGKVAALPKLGRWEFALGAAGILTSLCALNALALALSHRGDVFRGDRPLFLLISFALLASTLFALFCSTRIAEGKWQGKARARAAFVNSIMLTGLLVLFIKDGDLGPSSFGALFIRSKAMLFFVVPFI